MFDENAALEATALVTRACLERGVKVGVMYVFNDPDRTFTASVSEQWVNVQVMNNEDQGQSRLLVDCRDGAPFPVIYEPGPWELRLRHSLGL